MNPDNLTPEDRATLNAGADRYSDAQAIANALAADDAPAAARLLAGMSTEELYGVILAQARLLNGGQPLTERY